MSASLSSVLDDEPVVIEQKQEPEVKIEPAEVTPEPKAEEVKEVKAEKPETPKMTEKERAFFATAMDERKKRQELERRIDEMEAQQKATVEPPPPFWENPEQLLLEIHRVLLQKGIFCITFAEESFMKQLPFTQFEFDLYSTEKAEKLIEKTPFKIISKETLTEKVKSKTGELVDRDFTTLVLEK